ncbi:MAG: MFS transporter [Sphingobium sp.]|nr:MFS transporter [Sphingobium sp.]
MNDASQVAGTIETRKTGMKATHSRHDRLLVALLCLAGLLNYTDRNLFPVLAQSIKQDLGLSDLELGLLGGPSFAFVYALAGLPVAHLADRKNRVRIIAATTMIWSVFCMACGLAQNFGQMLAARAGVGIGEAGFFPATTSLVSDQFPTERRASILSIIQLGSPASTIFCAILAATIGTAWGWRAALIAAGLPGILIGLAIWALLREPKRGAFDSEPAAKIDLPWKTAIAQLLRQPTFLRVTIAAALVTFCVNAIAVFYVSYFVRIHDWTLAQGGYAFGVIQCIAATVGLLVGGFGADRLARRDARWRCWLPAIGLVFATGAYIAAFQQREALVAAGLILAGGMCLFTFYTPSIAIVQELADPRSRATAVAIFLLAGTVLGVGFGPVAAGFASDLFAQRHFGHGSFLALCPGGNAPPGATAILSKACIRASAAGLTSALTISPIPLLLASATYVYASRTLKRDTRAAVRHK